ncbi:hypothetical protein L228DRAFT_242842 [Xylona heveae TC161]|uniref:Uncharacterized protein n=1 Tax=Xylona heveae (strain CBS 132557 / TC161) TaxID=1328760 RepID=A0A165JL72_XYLHT|nr:hypothetical protein L228DRAFT_242842 [Xylona heveae TC161]KZF26377.1 hypothetical protein L228DRAFT_242842 [Xylona heveae TC161]
MAVQDESIGLAMIIVGMANCLSSTVGSWEFLVRGLATVSMVDRMNDLCHSALSDETDHDL